MVYNTSDLFGCSPSYMNEPEANKRDKRIFGLELEANDRNSWSNFSRVVDDNIICIPHNRDAYNRKYTHALAKPDCTAEYEIVMQAERPRNILLKLKQINKYLNPETTHNHSAGEEYRNDCSAHIHINNRYLHSKGISVGTMIGISEILAPYLYVMSGRVHSVTNSIKWAHSLLEYKNKCDIFTHPSIRARILDDIVNEEDLVDYASYRYYIMNAPTSHGTSELRIFTNKCSFDYNRIKLFIETADFLIDLADNYEGMTYTESYEDIVDDFTNFLSRYKRRRNEVKKLNLDFIFGGTEEYIKFLHRERNIDIHGILNRGDGSISQTLRNIRTLQETYNIDYDRPVRVADIDTNAIAEFFEERIYHDSNIINNTF